jgi:hypothetical protein
MEKRFMKSPLEKLVEVRDSMEKKLSSLDSYVRGDEYKNRSVEYQMACWEQVEALTALLKALDRRIFLDVRQIQIQSEQEKIDRIERLKCDNFLLEYKYENKNASTFMD